MSDVDVVAIREALRKSTPMQWQCSMGEVYDNFGNHIGTHQNWADGLTVVLLRNNAEALLDALERAQAASEGVDMLIAQAERRGAAKALRASADWFVARNTYGPLGASDWLLDRAEAIETGADL